ncbi:MAG: metal ABC transporter substrate-binding protein [Actinomycetota bacterium]
MVLTAVAAMAFIPLSAGCSPAATGAPGRISVVASFYPVYEAALRVGAGRVEVTNLTPAGAEPHDLELSPKEVDLILDADVVLYVGSGFQPAVDDAVRDRSSGVTVDLLQDLRGSLRSTAGTMGGLDPHVWLDPVLMGQLANEVRLALAAAAPTLGAVFERNGRGYRAEIAALDRRYRTGLASCQRRLIVTAHAAFGYLAARYGLTEEPVAGISPEAEPDPRRLAELSELVRREGVTTVFTEELVSPRVADTLAREAGVGTAVLNPLEGLTERETAAGEDYVSVMDRNLAVLRSALGCR